MEEQEIREHQSTDKFPCKSCGANMIFEPEKGCLSCNYCGSKVDICNEKTDIKEYGLKMGKKADDEKWGTGTRVFKCDACGAETILEPHDAAQFCTFCGSSHIVRNDGGEGIVPESLIPFKIGEKSANELFSAWIRKRYFAPRALKNSYSMQRLKGVYLPCWTFDSHTSSTYVGEGGTYYYETETKWVTENGKQVQKTEQVRKIRWWPTSGTYSKYFDDVPVNASRNIDANLMSQLEPFDRSALLPYKPEYLSGFLAERYSLGLEEGWERARRVIDTEIDYGVRNKINADVIRNLSISTFYNDSKYKLILLPTWISAYKYKNKSYKFLINGQTGKVTGHSPLSPWKILFISLLGVGIIALIATLFMR